MAALKEESPSLRKFKKKMGERWFRTMTEMASTPSPSEEWRKNINSETDERMRIGIEKRGTIRDGDTLNFALVCSQI